MNDKWVVKFDRASGSILAYEKKDADWLRKMCGAIDKYPISNEQLGTISDEKERSFRMVVNGVQEPITQREHLWVKFMSLSDRLRRYDQAIEESKDLSLQIDHLEKQNAILREKLKHHEEKVKPQDQKICPICNGDGGAKECYKCSGSGWVGG